MVYLFIGLALVSDILRDDVLIGILPDRVYIVSFRPELATPQLLLHFGMVLKDHLRRDALGELGEARR